MPAIAGFGVPFVLVTYLALQAGGFDLVLRSQVGIFVWWVILLGVGAGLLPVIRLTRIGWTGVAILGGLLIWTAVATISWTESTERSLIELSRVATLSGILALLVLVQAREGLRRSVCALGAAVAFIAAIALLSRYQPGWFPDRGIPNAFPNYVVCQDITFVHFMVCRLLFAGIKRLIIIKQTTSNGRNDGDKYCIDNHFSY